MALLPEPLLVLALAAATGFAVGLLARMMFRLVGAWTGKSQGRLDDSLVKALASPLSLVLGVVAAGSVLYALSPRLDADTFLSGRRLLVALLAIGAAWGVVRAIRVVLEETGRRRQRFLPATRVGGRLIAVILYVAVFLTVMQQYGLAITPLLTGLGIAGLAAALALQDTLGNFFAGISIQTGQAVQPGHFVRLEAEKLEGYVEQVGWRTTRIRTLNGNTIVIPNAKLANSIVTDTYLPSPDQAVQLEFLVALDADPAKVMAILVEEAKAAAKTNPGIMKESAPAAQLAGIQEYALKFTIAFRVTEYVQQGQAQHEIRLRVLERFRTEGIRIPYPTRHLLEEAVAPLAKRKAAGPAGFTSGGRPKPKKRAVAHAPDPQLVEAEKAKAEIAAQQAEIAEKKGDPAPTPPGPQTLVTPGSAAAAASEGAGAAPAHEAHKPLVSTAKKDDASKEEAAAR